MSFLRQPNRQYWQLLASQSTSSFKPSLSGSETDVSTSNENLSNEEKYVIRHTARQEPQGQENLQQSSNRSSLRDSLQSNRSSLDVSSSSYNTLIIHSIGEDTWTGRNSGGRDTESGVFLQGSPVNGGESVQKMSASPAPSTGSSVGHGTDETGVQITEIPDDYLSQSSVLKHLAKEVKGERIGDPRPPPDYNKCMKQRKQCFKAMSKSQPDLSMMRSDDDVKHVPRPRTKGRVESTTERDWQTVEMVELIMKENGALKMELEQCYQRVAKTELLEQEVVKIHRSHDELVQLSERRERLEKMARQRLQTECRKLQDHNKALREQLGLLTSDGHKRELNKREILITQLITQNKELVAAKERQEIELAAQRATLQEQRTHIDILESALTNAQGNVVRLEEESRKKQVYVDRVMQLQHALTSHQLVSERREQTERQLRQQLEMELERTKRDDCGKSSWADIRGLNSDDADLKKRLREREEMIMRLEGECSKWEQRYLEENALRQAAIDAASIPKDAKIAALEKTSQETEKIIAEARNEKIRHMDEAHASQKKVTDLESRLKDLESKLAERDAMIRVLQKHHTYDKDVSSMLSRSPHHTPHPSLAGSDLDHVLGASVSREELVSSVLTSSTSFGSGNSYTGSDSSYMPSYKFENKCFDSTKKTLDNQIKEIDNQLGSQLLSKRALCCFPGLTNPVAAQRKGTIPKPLLAGVTSSSSSSVSQPSASGAVIGTTTVSVTATNADANTASQSGQEMLLLEKQGRSSQQQRMSEKDSTGGGSSSGGTGTPPTHPSSLPRPPRTRYNRLPSETPPERKKSEPGMTSTNNRKPSPARSMIPPPRKLGDYGRLSDSGSSSVSLRKPSPRLSASRDSASTFSDNSSSSLPHPKVRFYGSGPVRRGSSLGRDSKPGDSPTPTPPAKYRIQF
ncbi:PREDICTED: angiomotin-like isoform X2 [Nicrophorus vespilloides]|nr:PREDICTED: angiomotin-like isoform X2 [Nicrophorus vespilloides]